MDFIFPKKGILSIWGDYGVGKTTLSIQKALNFAYDNKKSIYIYTKMNLPFEKIKNLLQKSTSNHLDNIIFIKSLHFEALYSLVFDLEFIILKNPKKFHLIIIDSITDLYRLELDRESKEKNFLFNYKLSQILANLYYLNENYGINIIVINNISNINQNGQTIEVQSGGRVMDYWVNTSIKIERTDKLNCRRFIFREKDNEKVFETLVNLTENGFI